MSTRSRCLNYICPELFAFLKLLPKGPAHGLVWLVPTGGLVLLLAPFGKLVPLVSSHPYVIFSLPFLLLLGIAPCDMLFVLVAGYY